MQFKDLKLQMLLPNNEFIINKSVTIRDKECMILGMTSQNEENKLWIIMHEENAGNREGSFDDDCYNYEEIEYENTILTNRDEMVNNISNETFHLNLKEIEIQGEKIVFNSSAGTCLCDNNYDLCMALQHFVEKGVSLDSFDEYYTSDLMFFTYNQQDGDEFPKVDMSKDLNMKLITSPDSKQILINKPLTVSFGDNINEKHCFFHEETNRDYYFYINKVEHYDIWEEANKHFDSEQMKKAMEDANVSNEQLMEMKKNYYEFVEQTCPKGMDLAMIEYETEDDIQLNFYTKEFLDAKIEHQDKCGILLFKPDEPTGPHGLKNRICMLKAVDKNFYGSIDIELFSWYKKLPEDIITIK